MLYLRRFELLEVNGLIDLDGVEDLECEFNEDLVKVLIILEFAAKLSIFCVETAPFVIV